ncbi:PAAR domain-containing protein [Thalassomonas viridans]|uniref:PAAR domain-containing protein n=1 Tax=Thalassomonas viridans TaxID=137584 RepID=A0AAE9Z8L6_9GAMM|nr:PAAR domain-containing protein [Thalassomonas viridans]
MALPAATVTHMHLCPKVTGNVPHIGGPIVNGSPNVLIGNLPAARIGDTLVCVGPPDKITQGSTGVFINGKGAARLGDGTAHGGKITEGNPTVLIGDSASVPVETTNFNSFKDTLAGALINTRSPGEALGKAGMIQAKKRLGLKTDPRYIDRYHGPDDMAQDNSGILTELESKGCNKNSTAIAKNNEGYKQCSKHKNKSRAKLMSRRKHKKIDEPSNRQGGPYTQDEIDLWKEVKASGGDKRHLSTHTNTDKGLVRVYERDDVGDITEMIDEFILEDFEKLKSAIEETFKNE